MSVHPIGFMHSRTSVQRCHPYIIQIAPKEDQQFHIDLYNCLIGKEILESDLAKCLVRGRSNTFRRSCWIDIRDKIIKLYTDINDNTRLFGRVGEQSTAERIAERQNPKSYMGSKHIIWFDLFAFGMQKQTVPPSPSLKLTSPLIVDANTLIHEHDLVYVKIKDSEFKCTLFLSFLCIIFSIMCRMY